MLLTRVHDIPSVRRVWLAVVCGALLLARPAVGAAPAEDRGIVVRIQTLPTRLTIQELDGTIARFVIRRTTVVTLNGHRVRFRRLHAGDVATVDHAGRFALTVAAVRP